MLLLAPWPFPSKCCTQTARHHSHPSGMPSQKNQARSTCRSNLKQQLPLPWPAPAAADATVHGTHSPHCLTCCLTCHLRQHSVTAVRSLTCFRLRLLQGCLAPSVQKHAKDCTPGCCTYTAVVAACRLAVMAWLCVGFMVLDDQKKHLFASGNCCDRRAANSACNLLLLSIVSLSAAPRCFQQAKQVRDTAGKLKEVASNE